MELKNKMIAILVAPKFQDDEAILPGKFLREAGAEVRYVGLQKGTCPGKGQASIQVDCTVSDLHSTGFDGLIIPGGSAPESLRLNKEVLRLVREFAAEAKPIAAICHGPQVLISAGLARGRTLTGFQGIRDDLVNAGATFLDQEVVIDGNFLTARVPQDIPTFNRTFAEMLVKYDREKAPWAHANPAQVLEYAIFNEIRACSVYEALGKDSRDKLAKAKFKFLAETERGHREKLEELFMKLYGGQKPEPRDLGAKGGEATAEISNKDDLLKILNMAMAAEDEANSLYTSIAEKVRHPEARKLFLALAEEEAEHRKILEVEYALRVSQTLPSALEKEPWFSEDLW